MNNSQLKIEQKWLMQTQTKLQKLINSPYWDSIKISDLMLQIITHIMNPSNVKQLSPAINERIVNDIITDLTAKLKLAKQNCRT